MVFDITILVLLLMILWTALLSFLFWRFHQQLSGSSGGSGHVQRVVNKLVNDMGEANKDIAVLFSRCDTIEKENLVHIQKIGLIRFNPFKDTGGEQSFIVAFTDRNDTGIVISSLYSRSGTRWYAKRVMKGKGIEFDLSDEEKRALKEAKTL